MRIDPVFAEMRRDPGLQRRAQAAMRAAGDAWAAAPDVAPLLADFRRYGEGAELAECPALAQAFAAGGPACRLTDTLVQRFLCELVGNRVGQLPFRHGFDGTTSTLLLSQSGRAQLILHAYEPGEWSHSTASFSDAERYVHVLAGQGEGQIARRDPVSGAIALEPVALERGRHFALKLDRHALQVQRASCRLVTLRLHRFAAAPGPSCDYRLADGALLHQAAGDIRESRFEMMIALLGRMGRDEAAPVMAALAREAGDSSLRWQALRECLALDTAAGFHALVELARRPADPLAAPAGALRAQLVEAHPQLRALEGDLCLA